MTPLRAAPMRSLSFGSSSDADMSIETDDRARSSESMLASPPRAGRVINLALRPSSTFASRLFADDEHSGTNGHQNLQHQNRKELLKPFDLNSEWEDSEGKKSDPPTAMQRKRQAEEHIGRYLSFEDIEDDQSSPVFMMQLQSPRASPSTYRSPSAFHKQFHKSPTYRTLDGRTVQSKNPFSPMCEDGATTHLAQNGKPVDLGDSLGFPIGFEDDDSSELPNMAPQLKQRLPSTFHQRDGYPYSNITRDGYPEREGRYSFTGSPIREIEASLEFRHPNNANAQKLRRIHEADDVATASAHEESTKKDLQIQTNVDYYNGAASNGISPTEVCSFPMPSLPSTPGGVPPTPSKPKHYHRRHPNRYTPVRKTAVPQTPMPDRRARSFDEDDDSEQNNSCAVQSRFQSDFDVLGELGNGSFGNVFKVLSRLDGCMYAIKVAHRPAKGNADKDRMLKEVYALAALSDQADTATFHIVRYHQAWMEENRLYIQTELCTSTLATEMERGLLHESRLYKLLREMCLALEFIHKNEMVHLDIKPENVFIKNDQFKLGDFVLVSKVSSHDVEEGDSRYMSIELLSGDHDDLTKSDIFSLGITMYEVCLGGAPLPSNGREWQALRSAQIPTLPAAPKELLRLIQQMMNPSYASRPSASELLRRPQLLSNEQKALLEERNKVVQANLALAEQTNRLRMLNNSRPPPPVPRRKGLLVRANTWNGN